MGLGGTQLLAAALLLLLCVSVQLQGACGAAAEGEIGEGGACGAAAEGEIGKGGGGSRPYTGSGSYSSDSVETSSPGAFIIALALALGTHLDWLPYIYIPRVKYITSLVACLCISVRVQLVDHMSVQLRTHKVYFNLTLLCVCAHLQEGCCDGVGERGGGESRHRGSCPYSSGGAGGRDPLGDSGAHLNAAIT